MNNYQTTNHKELMKLGFPEHTARNIIKQAKKIAILEFETTRKNSQNLVQLKKSPFDNRRLGIAPTKIVEELIGFPLFTTESEKNEYKN